MVIPGNRYISGTNGKVWWNGELIAEVKAFQATVSIDRAEIINENGDVDSKMQSKKGEGTLTLSKVYSRGLKALLSAYGKNEDPRSQFISVLDDPDAYKKQKERVVLNNVWFNEITLANWEKGNVVEQEWPFGFTPGDSEIPETINS